MQITLETSWRAARKMIKEDPRYEKYSSSDRRREREFNRWMEERRTAAKNDFRELLKESKHITYK